MNTCSIRCDRILKRLGWWTVVKSISSDNPAIYWIPRSRNYLCHISLSHRYKHLMYIILSSFFKWENRLWGFKKPCSRWPSRAELELGWALYASLCLYSGSLVLWRGWVMAIKQIYIWIKEIGMRFLTYYHPNLLIYCACDSGLLSPFVSEIFFFIERSLLVSFSKNNQWAITNKNWSFIWVKLKDYSLEARFPDYSEKLLWRSRGFLVSFKFCQNKEQTLSQSGIHLSKVSNKPDQHAHIYSTHRMALAPKKEVSIKWVLALAFQDEGRLILIFNMGVLYFRSRYPFHW